MAICYRCCKHLSSFGFCDKYNSFVIISKNPAHPGLRMHPLDYLSVFYDYYKKPEDIQYLIDIAEKFQTDETSKNICEQYRKRGYITF